MSANEFKEIVENFFESIHLEREEREYVCEIYYKTYIEPEAVDGEQSILILCANTLAEIIKDEGDYNLPDMPIESFREIMFIQTIKYPFDCSRIYKIVEDMKICENTFKQKICKEPIDNELFEDKLHLNKDTLKKLFNMQKLVFDSCVEKKEDVHKILEEWLNFYIMPKFKEKQLSKEDMDNIIKVAELVENNHEPFEVILKYPEARHIMFDNNQTFRGVFNVKVLINVMEKLLVIKPVAGTEVFANINGKKIMGSIIGIYDEKNFIVQHSANSDGYTASVVNIANIRGL